MITEWVECVRHKNIPDDSRVVVELSDGSMQVATTKNGHCIMGHVFGSDELPVVAYSLIDKLN
tara:strand:+ start:568 stop:756 length:189 start_codon:yes stop_codon:yes gene_type:complete